MANELVKASNDYFIAPATSVGDALQRYQDVKDFITRALRKGIDYGEVPGIAKPTLLKPGAEKLGALFGLSPVFVLVERIEDWNGKDHGGEQFFYYLYKCELYRGERKVGEGDGSCNSFEKKYRYRWCSEEDLPETIDKNRVQRRDTSVFEFKFAIDQAKSDGKYGKPPEYWQKFKDAIADGTALRKVKATSSGKSIEGYEIPGALYRIPNEDVADQVNTMQKMAQKRAFVASILVATNASDYFTQDMEDFTDHKYVEGEFVESSFVEVKSDATSEAPKKEEAPAETTKQETTSNKTWSGKAIAECAKIAGCETKVIVSTLAQSMVLKPGEHDDYVVKWIGDYKSKRDANVSKEEAAMYADEKLTETLTMSEQQKLFPDAEISVIE